ncbi:MAG: hypothetical protein EOO46_03820 [Flavobacterium sp.]|nr:MAG: hypothetical protein EOO46_03820 [Flavobacterium sp.]
MADARAQKIYDDLIGAGVDPSQLEIIAPKFDAKKNETKLSVVVPSLPDNIREDQIIIDKG